MASLHTFCAKAFSCGIGLDGSNPVSSSACYACPGLVVVLCGVVALMKGGSLLDRI